MWFLTEELVVLSLADDGTSDDTKSRIVARMLAAGQPRVFRPGKPVMKANLLRGRQPEVPQLYDFAGKRSWLLFHLLELDVAWLHMPVAQWEAVCWVPAVQVIYYEHECCE